MIHILNKFLQEFQKGNIYQDRTIPMMRKLCLAFLLNFAEEASWAELAFRGVKIRDVMGTTNIDILNTYVVSTINHNL